MTSTAARHLRRLGAPLPPRTSPARPSKRLAEQSVRREEAARRETAAVEAGRWLRRTGRVSLPVRSRRRSERTGLGARGTDLGAPRLLEAMPQHGERK